MNPIIVALDVPTLDAATALAARVAPAVGGVKIGLELFDAEGPRALDAFDLPIFLDVKLHDIPTTVARAVRTLTGRPLEMINVHALGGRAMMEAAAAEKRTTKLLAVTILTSMNDQDLKEVGLPPADEAVPALAVLAKDSGCDGVVCAPTDIALVRRACPKPFLIVTPGIRPAGASTDDQARIATPKQAIEAGADRLVIGRPITRAADPRAAAEAIIKELS